MSEEPGSIPLRVRRTSSVRFEEDNDDQPPNAQTDDVYAVSSGFDNPASRVASLRSSARVSRQPSADITDEQSIYDDYLTVDEAPNRCSAVPFSATRASFQSSDRPISGETLTDASPFADQDERKVNSASGDLEGFEPELKRAKSFDSFTYDQLVGRGHDNRVDQTPRETEKPTHASNEGHHGFFQHVKDSLKRLAHNDDKDTVSDSRTMSRVTSNNDSLRPSRDTSRTISRRSSWSSAYSETWGDKRRTLDNFERSLAINEEAEETYLMDEGEESHWGLRLRRGLQKSEGKDEPDEKGQSDEKHHHHHHHHSEGRKSYHERRKRDKHIIKHHKESKEEYQKFILIFAKSLLAFGSPSHRIEAQLISLTRVFELEAQFQHTPGIIQVSFGNPEIKSSETCLIKSDASLALGRIHATHNVYRLVLHDDMAASTGTRQLRKLLHAPPQYGALTRYILALITCLLICGIAFGGSLNDMWVAGIMGLIVRFLLNIAAKSDLSASGSEVFTAALVSFIARGVSSVHSQIWCFTSISSAGVISLLPGHLILAGSLDIAGKNQPLGAPKIVSGIMTSLYLGFGLTLGSDVFLFVDRPARRAVRAAASKLTSNTIIQGFFQANNGTSSDSFEGTFGFADASSASQANIIDSCFRDPNWGWYLQPLPYWSLFILVPIFAFCVSMNNQQHWWSRQMFVMVSIACVAFWITRLCNLKLGLHNHPDYVSFIGSWLVGVLGNGYSRRFGGTAFTAMLTGILLLVPDGLSAAGGLSQNYQTAGQDEYTQSLDLARKMISVIIGILAGVYSSAAIIYLFGKKKNAALVTF